MIIEQIPIGPIANFGYILGCEETRIAALIDPAFEPEKLVARARELDLDVEWILNTHGHFDHINGNEVAVEMTGAKIIAYSGATFHADHKVDHGDKIKIGNLHIDILFTRIQLKLNFTILKIHKLHHPISTIKLRKAGSQSYYLTSPQSSLIQRILNLFQA